MGDDVLSIEDAFGDLTDPRSRTLAYDLTQMLVVALCAILSGVDSWVTIQVWGEEKLDWLRRHIPLEQGIPRTILLAACSRLSTRSSLRPASFAG